MVKRRFSVWATVVSLMAVSGNVHATNSASEIVALRQLWEAALEAEAANDWASAEQALSEAVGIKETPGLRFHLAHCREMQRKWVEALVDYKSVEEQILAGARAPDVEPLLKPAIARLEAKVPKLTIVVRPVEGMTLRIDGQLTSVKLLGLPIALNPGGHRIAVAAPGVEPAIRNINLQESETRTLPLVLTPQSDANAAQSDQFSAKPYVLLAEASIALGALGFAWHHHVEANAARQQKLSDDFASKQDGLALGFAVGSGVFAAAFATTWLLWSDEVVTSEHANAQVGTRRREGAAVRLSTGWSKVTLDGVF